MFPTFISILDIQSWWEVPSIAHFCSLFRTAFNLLDFDIEDLEEALLTDGTEETSWLQELIVRLLSGCLPNNEISTFNYQMFLRRLFRQKCQEHDRYNPFNTDVDFQLLPLRTKVDILQALCDFRLDAEDVLEQLKNLEADSLRVEPLGYDNNSSAYWYFYGTRLYREDFKTRNNKKNTVWQVICFTEDDWFQLTKKFKKSTSKAEVQLHHTLSENFLPELPRLFKEKERLARKRLLENQPRRKSSRIKNLAESEVDKEEDEDRVKSELEEKKHKLDKDKDKEKQRKKELEEKRREAYERRNKLKENHSADEDEDSQSEQSLPRYEMAKPKDKKPKARQRKPSKDKDPPKRGKKSDKSGGDSASKPTTVGRQTNNSLAAATGQIVIQPTPSAHKKKLKTSQVFRQTDEDLQTGMHKILDFVKNHEDAWPFADPVDEDYAPNYYSIIRKPMDLQRMEDRLDSGDYTNFSRFRDDFQLIVDNCRLYNGAENEYTEMVDNLLQIFERATEKYLDQISSSDDEIAVEYLDRDGTKSTHNKKKKPEDKKLVEEKKPTKRKPTLAAQTDKKRERSPSEESRSVSPEPPPVKPKKTVEKRKSGRPPTKKVKGGKPVNKKVKSRSASPIHSSASSPAPPSWPPSPEERFDFSPKKKKKHEVLNKKRKIYSPPVSPKPKDKHNKLRETIEKLKAKSEISNKVKEYDFELEDNPKENKRKDDKGKKKLRRKDLDLDDGTSSGMSGKPAKKSGKTTVTTIEALTLATEQTLKDINKWLDDTPKYTDFSSADNSPSYPALEEFDPLVTTGKPPAVVEKKPDKPKKDFTKDMKRRPFRDPVKLFKRREVQRTIDRLQPGKSKGNLITNVQNPNKTDEIFPLTKIKDTKNALIVKTDTNAPKLSLGSVLDSFGKHKFVDDAKKDPVVENEEKKPKVLDVVPEKPPENSEGVKPEQPPEPPAVEVAPEPSSGGATPNLSAWFKAFGAPKVQPPPKKPETKEEKPKEEVEVTTPAPRQRKISTGSSMSERSSFSQDMDSPRVGIDERLGAYPAPYPSPLHRSPSGATPSPRPDNSPKPASYPTFNGQMRVGFYQDTVSNSNKNSPDKSCSPRDANPPQSPAPAFAQYSDNHVYTPPSTTQNNNTYSYPYYSYSSTNPTPPYEVNNPASYYDTNKSLTDQYQAKTTLVSSASPQNDSGEKSAVFPVKKRAYNEESHYEELQTVRDGSKEAPKYIHQNIPEPKALAQTQEVNYNKPQAQSNVQQQQMSYPAAPPQYNSATYQNEPNYPLNIPSRPLVAQTTAPQQDLERKLDMSKYTNMGYNGPDVNFPRQYNHNYSRAPSATQTNTTHNYTNPIIGYNSSTSSNSYHMRATQEPPRTSYNNPLEVEQPLLRGNIANLSHIVDRCYNNPDPSYYSDKGLGAAAAAAGHMFNKQASPMFSQANYPGYNPPGMQSAAATSMYGRQGMELQNTRIMAGGSEGKGGNGGQVQEKKSKKRKSKSTAAAAAMHPTGASADPQQQQQQQQQQSSSNQGFQSYAGLKPPNAPPPLEPSAISLKTSSVVPGSAFNFGPTPSGIGLYTTDKDAYPNFLDDFRTAAPNYYMAAAAAAHHRSTPENSEKQPRMAAHQSTGGQGTSYGFLGAPQARSGYPIGAPFMPPGQAQLMEASSPLYQHYLQAGVLNQGLLGPPGAYGPGYHPALSMRQPYDAMPRPWI